MSPAVRQREDVRQLADRLMLEYAGALPPGRILAVVHLAHRAVAGAPGASWPSRLAATEHLARTRLTERIRVDPGLRGVA